MNQLILYSYFRSSASYRIRIALNIKSQKYTYKAVHLLKNGGEQFSDSYKKINPSAQVPTLVDDDFVISESMAILDYLEQKFPDPRLFPENKKLRAEVIRFCEVINAGIQPLQNLKILGYLEKRYPNDKTIREEWLKKWVGEGMAIVEQLLEKSSQTYCFGNTLTAADVLLVPQVVSSNRFGVDTKQFTRITHVYENCSKLKAFEEAHPSKQPDFEQ